MNDIYLSKSRYCKCVQCQKILWLKKYKPETAIPSEKDAVFENGNKVGKLAKGLFGRYEDIEFNENLNVMIERTKELLKSKPNIITEASFNYNNNFCSIDILKNDVDGVEIYEVKSSTKVNNIYIDDVSYQYYILSKLGFNVKKVSLVHINNEYIRQESLELDKLFTIEDLTENAISKKEEIENNIIEFNNFMQEHQENNEPDIDIGMKCTEPYLCDFWNYCTRNLPKPNVFDIGGGMHRNKKFEKYYEGKISFEDLQHEDLNPKYLEQIDFELNNLEPKIDKEAIRDIINSLNHIFNIKKIGHTGTLDPLATGVLVCCIGKYTKLVNLLTSETKEYIAEIKLGIKTDTLDITGNVISTNTFNITKSDILKVFDTFPKTYLQTVPLYSSVHVNGKRLYEYARDNTKVTLPKRKVSIYNLELISFNKDIITFKTKVSKGTYIRSLIEDICSNLNTYGTMNNLIRTKQGNFSIDNSYTLEDIKNGNYKLLNIKEFLDYPVIELPDTLINKVLNGNSITNSFNITNKVIFTYKNKDIAIYEVNNQDLKPYIMF